MSEVEAVPPLTGVKDDGSTSEATGTIATVVVTVVIHV